VCQQTHSSLGRTFRYLFEEPIPLELKYHPAYEANFDVDILEGPQKAAGIHADRTSRGDRDHRDSRRDAFAGVGESEEQGDPDGGYK
jgi:hypothetical protein